MKILAIITTNSYQHDLRPELEFFIEMHHQGIHIDVCTQANTEYAKILKDEGIAIVGDFPTSKRDKEFTQHLRTLLINGNYDIVHSLHRKSIACALQATKGIDVKIVAYRGASGLHWHDPFAYANALNPRIDKVICVCNRIRDDLRKQLFFKKDKAITIYKGHDITWFDNVQATERKFLGVSEHDFVLTCTANDRKWKGIPTLLDAIGLLPTDSKIKLVLIGNGLNSPYYLKKIDANINKDKIISLGFRDDAMSIAKTSDIILQTSYKNEGLSRSTIEGMALGCAPIVTDAGGNAELVIDRECGLVVPIKNAQAMADAIMELYNNPQLVKQYQEASYERIKTNFTVKKTAQETIAVYNELVK